MEIKKQEIFNLIATEGLSKTYNFLTSGWRYIIIPLVLFIPLVASLYFFAWAHLYLLLIASVIYLYIFSDISRIINDSSNELWVVYWHNIIQFLKFQNTSEEAYQEYVRIFWEYWKIFLYASLTVIYITLIVIFERFIPLVLQILNLIIISLLEAVFLRDLLLPKIKFRRKQLLLGKVEFLINVKRQSLYLLYAAVLMFNFGIFLDDILYNVGFSVSFERLAIILAGINVISGVLLGSAYVQYYKFIFEVTYMPMRHHLFDALAPIFFLLYILLNELINVTLTNILLIILTFATAALALTLSYVHFATSCWGATYMALTSVKNLIRTESPRQKFFDTYTIDARRFALMAPLSPIIVALLMIVLIYPESITMIPGISGKNILGGTSFIVGFFIGVYIAFKSAVPVFVRDIYNLEAQVKKLERRVKARKEAREMKKRKKKKVKEKEKVEVVEKDEYEKMMMELSRLTELWEEE